MATVDDEYANRNGDVREVNRKYYDRDVCRLYLVGLCPHELFQSTEMDMGRCPKVHSLQLRKEYEEAKSKGIDNYERELEDVINKLILDCDAKIGRVFKLLNEHDAINAIKISVSEVTETSEVLELSKEIKEKLKEADKYDLEGLSDMKIQVFKIVEELRIKRAEKQSKLLLDLFTKDMAYRPRPLPTGTPNAQTQVMAAEKRKKADDLCKSKQGSDAEAQEALKASEALKVDNAMITDRELRLCDICGVFLGVYDSGDKLADHFGGKLHLGYMQIREKLAELQEERNKSPKTDRDRDRDSFHSYNLRSCRRSRSREHSRDCDRHRRHDRYY